MAEQGEPASNADSGNDVVATFCEGLQNRSNEELLGLLEKARDLITTREALKESSWSRELPIKTEAVVKAEEGAHRKYEAILDEILGRGLPDDLEMFGEEDLWNMHGKATNLVRKLYGQTADEPTANMERAYSQVAAIERELCARAVNTGIGQHGVSAATGWPSSAGWPGSSGILKP